MSTHLKTRTDYDLDQLEELQRVMGRTFARKQTLRKRGSALVTGGLSMGIGLMLALRHNSVVLSLLCCILGVLLMGWSVFFYPFTAWSASKAMGKNREGNEFHFEREEILAVRGTESSRFPYTNCAQLLETEQNFYFIMENGQGLMLDKKNVKGGTPADLRALLEEKCGKTAAWAGKKETKHTQTQG
ncbi:MAG: YcxB family protein [Lawsonibacter sp.]